MPRQPYDIAAFGDFQTPEALARQVCGRLVDLNLAPAALLEPTCGQGAFLLAGLDQFGSASTALGAELNAEYVAQARAKLAERADSHRATIVEADFFATDWGQVIADLPQPLLVLGNLPWVTNAQLGVLQSQNLPVKSNFQQRSGLDALTGKANFDISEWMLIQLFEALHGRVATLAMLCKASVARKVLVHGWKQNWDFERSVICPIDAKQHFGAAVDAVLLVTHFRPGARDEQARVESLGGSSGEGTTIGYSEGYLLADAEAFRAGRHLLADEPVRWRSGIKHDCAKVMELRREGDAYRNGLGEIVELEDELLYPLAKCTEVARGRLESADRVMLVTQRRVGEDTSAIESRAPKTWRYLTSHAERFQRRGSSIYKRSPPYAIFGVGEYSFVPWKVAISGLHKQLVFRAVGPRGGRPVVFDDATYFLPAESREEAESFAELLNGPVAQAFYRAFVFWDVKRPITAELLQRLDLRRLAAEGGSVAPFAPVELPGG